MSRYRWTILALGTAAQASYSAVFLGIPVLAPQFRDEFGLSLTQIGVVLAAFSVGSVGTLLAWGMLADRVGERSVLAAGLAVASITLALAAFTSGYVSLVLLLVVTGGAGASVNAASGRAVMGWFDPSQRGLALGIRQTALPLGGAAAAVALPPIAAAGGTQGGSSPSPPRALPPRSRARSVCGRHLPGRASGSATSSTRCGTAACGDSRSAAG